MSRVLLNVAETTQCCFCGQKIPVVLFVEVFSACMETVVVLCNRITYRIAANNYTFVWLYNAITAPQLEQHKHVYSVHTALLQHGAIAHTHILYIHTNANTNTNTCTIQTCTHTQKH